MFWRPSTAATAAPPSPMATSATAAPAPAAVVPTTLSAERGGVATAAPIPAGASPRRAAAPTLAQAAAAAGDVDTAMLKSLRRNVIHDVAQLRSEETNVMIVASQVQDGLSRCFTLPPSNFDDAAGLELYNRMFNYLDLVVGRYTASVEATSRQSGGPAALEAVVGNAMTQLEARQTAFENSVAKYLEFVQRDIAEQRKEFEAVMATLKKALVDAKGDIAKIASDPAGSPQKRMFDEVDRISRQVAPALANQQEAAGKELASLRTELAKCDRFDLRFDQLKNRIRDSESVTATLEKLESRLSNIVSLAEQLCPPEVSGRAAPSAAPSTSAAPRDGRPSLGRASAAQAPGGSAGGGIPPSLPVLPMGADSFDDEASSGQSAAAQPAEAPAKRGGVISFFRSMLGGRREGRSKRSRDTDADGRDDDLEEDVAE